MVPSGSSSSSSRSNKGRGSGVLPHGEDGSSFSVPFAAKTRETGPPEVRSCSLYESATVFRAWRNIVKPPKIKAGVRGLSVPETQIAMNVTMHDVWNFTSETFMTDATMMPTLPHVAVDQ